MKNLLRKAQGDVAEQVKDSGISMNGHSVSRIIMIGSLAIAGALSMVSTASAQDAGSILSNAMGGIGQAVGQQAGAGQNMGNEFGKILSVGMNTVGKVMTGGQVNGSDVGGTIGQVAGAVGGYYAGGNSQLGKTVGVLAGGAVGTVVGMKMGNTYDMNKANQQTAPIALTVVDQQGFVDGMRAAASKRQAISFTPNGSSPTQISPQQAGYVGYMANNIQKVHLPLLSSGAAQMPNDVMLAVANKAMEVVKVGQMYQQTTNDWDNAFLRNGTPAVKTEINNALVDSHDLLRAKTFEYVQVRNAAAAQGYDVSLVDGSIANNLAGLKEQTNYGFRVAARGSQLTNSY